MEEMKMTTFKERMAGYAAYHKHPKNKFTHLFGVPIVFWSPIIALNWIRIPMAGIEIPLGFIIYAGFMIWYFTLDLQLAVIMTILTIPVAYAFDAIARMPFSESITIFIALSVIGWAIQLVGHYFEGRRPALVDNLLQSLMGPLFVVLEVLFFLGIRKDLEKEVDKMVGVYQFKSN
jgi:uncharacterized membrane protein YGL010W